MNAPLKSELQWASELAREVATLSGRDFLTFLAELSVRLSERSESGLPDDREIMAALAEHFGDAEECAYLSGLSERV